MDLLELVRAAIYVLSTGLFYPVLLGLIALTGWMAVAGGMVLREALERRAGIAPGLAHDLRVLEEANSRDEGRDADGVGAAMELDSAISRAERRRARSLDRVRFAIRVGPSLGLMGTLIPMATALASLAGGDLTGLAESMVTAFATTVVGLGVGIVAYLLTLVRQRWAEEELAALEVRAEEIRHRILPEGTTPGGVHSPVRARAGSPSPAPHPTPAGA